MYAVKTPFWLKMIYPSLLWNKSRKEKTVYLTFDDGPTPEITNWVLNQLKAYNALGTFFVIGKNVDLHPELYSRVLKEGHAVGNHTQNHFKGWKHSTNSYLDNVQQCAETVSSSLFRPPYGRIKPQQIKSLKKEGYSIIMWDVLSADFDVSIHADKCYQNVIRNLKNGSIIVFHDSEKAWPRLKEALPKVLQFLQENGYQSKPL